MNEPISLGTNVLLMSPSDTLFLVVDVQQKLLRVIPQAQRVVWNIRRLLDGARLLGISTIATEQYPQGLGGTEGELAERLPAPMSKLAFSCCADSQCVKAVDNAGMPKILLVGIEAHVCVQQTALGLLSKGYQVYVVADVVASRGKIDCEYALRRMETCGATLTTTEAVLFEWCRTAENEQFKEISQLVRETAPDVK